MDTKIADFFNDDFKKFASYDSLRSLGNYIDGLKISSRKVIWTVLNTNIKKIKVSQLAAEVAKVTNYIHGEASMQGVITNLAKNYTGSNNINLLEPDGNFGCRLDETASAPRYIFIGKEKNLDILFNFSDINILEEQWFEGDKIEPKFLIPALPLILINGSDGIGTGFRQIILNRNYKDIIAAIKAIIENHPVDARIVPWYKNFNGCIELNSEGSWEISGNIYYLNDVTLIIDEIPIGYDLTSYLTVLETLKDQNIIKNFIDYSENDKFKFEIKITKAPRLSKTELLNQFKLIKRVTEIFSCINENNQIVEFKNELELLQAYVKIKLIYIEKRKEYLLQEYSNELKILKNKLNFISAIHNNKIQLKCNTDELIKQLEELKFDLIDNSYDYLLDLKIHTLSNDKYNTMLNKFKKLIEEYKELKNSTTTSLYLKDLSYLNEI